MNNKLKKKKFLWKPSVTKKKKKEKKEERIGTSYMEYEQNIKKEVCWQQFSAVTIHLFFFIIFKNQLFP